MNGKPGIALRVGIFFVIGLILLIGLSVRTTAVKAVKGGYTLYAYFDDGKGLEVGAPVTVAGVEAGKVAGVDFDVTKAKVRVSLMLRPEFSLPADSRARILFKSLLGQYYVDIKYGSPELEKLKPFRALPTEEVPDLNQLADLISKTSGDLSELVSSFNINQRKVIEQIIDMIEENRENIKIATQSFAEAAPKISQFATEAQNLMTDIKEGNSSIGKLIKDEELYDEVRGAINNFNNIATEINNGQGTMGKLIYSDQLHQQLELTLTRLNDASKDMTGLLSNNEPQINSLLNSLSSHLPQLEKTLDNMAEISEQIKTGQGTLGRLLNDPSLYEDTHRAVTQIEETFKESEEQGLLRTFATILFAGLM